MSIGDVGSAVANIAGAGINYIGARQAAADNKQAMKHGISWRVKDAKMAGISPLYALGAPTFSPAVNFDSSIGQQLGSGMSDLARAASKQWDKPTQMDLLAQTNASLQNDLLKAQIAKLSKEVLASPPGPVVSPPKFLYGATKGIPNPNPHMNPSQVGQEVAGWANELQGWAEANGLGDIRRWWSQLGVSDRSAIGFPTKALIGGRR